MRYWDASALVPLLVSETRTEQVRSILAEDSRVTTWVWTAIEMTSAIERRARADEIDRHQRRTALRVLDDLAATWDEVTDALAVRHVARPLLGRHPLRAADAAQLASALVLTRELGAPVTFVCLDERLADAAEREGLRIEPEPVTP